MFKRDVIRAIAKIYHFSQCRTIPVDKILQGGEHGLSGIQLSRHTGNIKRTSESVKNLPHVELIESYFQHKDDFFSSGMFLRTKYYQNAMECINLFGRYFTATNREEVLSIAKNFLKKMDSNIKVDDLPKSDFFSSDSGFPVVYPIKYSDCYQLHDGNHRVAMAIYNKESHVKVRVVNRTQLTNLQQLLLDVGWNVNKRDLYQPLSSPEISHKYWNQIRSCSDRLQLMLSFLKDDRPALAGAKTYIDLACNLGWFVKAMHDQGFDAHGLEIDTPSRKIAKFFLGIDERKIFSGSVQEFFEGNCNSYDYVSCFSFAHHVLIRSGEAGFKKFMTNVSGVVNKVLFFEMGDCEEAWFKNSLAGWNKTRIKDWLANSGLFSEVIVLGVDRDRVGSFKKNYGRALFACVK